MIKPIPTSVNLQQQLVSDIKSVISDAEDMLGATADQTGEKIAGLRARIEVRLRDAKLRLIEAEDSLVAKTKAAARATDDYVHESPWAAVGIAAGVGVLVGLIISRR
ncbi:MAG: DUF883 domain-containing protein [Polaromonas sp.]|nr:MAG: DUF883 domain-containing protein [Polaromonas sp.]